MPSTHLSLHYHLVFGTKDRHPFLTEEVRNRIHAYLGGTVRGLGGVAISVGGTADHVHLLVGLKATHRLSDFMRELKHESSQWIHEELGLSKFAWQEGYGAFSVSRSDIDRVTQYIQNQEEHHRTRSFQEEYLEFLREAGIDFDPKYL